MTPDISFRSPDTFTHMWICTTHKCPDIHKHTPKKNRIRKKNTASRQKAKDLCPKGKKNAGDSDSSDINDGGRHIRANQWARATQESSRQTELSTENPHTNRHCASKLKELTQSYAAEPQGQSQPKYQVKLSGQNKRAGRGPEAQGQGQKTNLHPEQEEQ